MLMDVYESILEARLNNRPCVLCTLIKTLGPSPQKPGAKMLVFSDNSIIGTIGGGVSEYETIQESQNLLKGEITGTNIFSTSEGKEVFMELIQPIPQLYIFGAGHVATALANFVQSLEFQTTIIDPRENVLKNNSLKNIKCFCMNYIEGISLISFNSNTYIVISTMSHETDRDVLINVASRPNAYIGLIGSQKKVENIREYCIKEKLLTKEQLDAIDMPIGIKIATKTPEEIAISIMAKLIDVKNNKTV